MALHMLLQLPWLCAAGAAAALLLERHGLRPRGFETLDANGLLGLTIASCVLAFWMVPAALDLALLDLPMRWAKYASLWIAGAMLALSLRRLVPETTAFFAGNLAWMMATAGQLYASEPNRLCVSYLVDQQRWAGWGLVCTGLLLALVASIRVFRSVAAAG